MEKIMQQTLVKHPSSKKYTLLGILSVFIVGAVAVFGVSAFNGDTTEVKITPKLGNTETVTPTLAASNAVKNELKEAQAKDFSFVLKRLYGGIAGTVSGEMPSDAKLSGGENSYTISNRNFDLSFGEYGEGELLSYDSINSYIPNDNFGELAVAKVGNSYYFVRKSEVSLNKSCKYLNQTLPAPCGPDTISVNTSAIRIKCEVKTQPGLDQCIQVMKSMNFEISISEFPSGDK